MKLQNSIWILSSLPAIQAARTPATGRAFSQDCQDKSLIKKSDGHWILQAHCKTTTSSKTREWSHIDLGGCYASKNEGLVLQDK